MKVRRLFTILLSAACLVLFTALPTMAATPPANPSSGVTDNDSFLTQIQKSRLDDKANAIQAATDHPVYVILVDDFSGSTPASWCARTLNNSSDKNGVAVVLAYDSHEFGACSPSSSERKKQKAYEAAMREFKSQPFSNHVAELGLRTFLDTYASSPSSSSTGSTDSFFGPAIGIGIMSVPLLIFLAAAFIIARIVVKNFSRNGGPRTRRSRGGRGSRTAPHRSPQEWLTILSQQLLQADEIVNSAADELQFAQAQFGELQTEEYGRALEAARPVVGQVFMAHRQMESNPNPAMIQTEAPRALEALDNVIVPLIRQRDEFAALREREAQAEVQLSQLNIRIKEIDSHLPVIEKQIETLAITNPVSALASIKETPAHIRALLQSASSLAREAQNALATNRGRAIELITIAQRNITLAQQQEQAVTDADKNLAESGKRLTEAIASITSDLNDAKRLNVNPQAFAPLVEAAEKAVRVGQEAQAGHADPLAALEALHTAENSLDSALAPMRSAEETHKRIQSSAERELQEAESRVEAARSVINSRSYAAQLDTRSLLHQAESELAKAKQTIVSDPQQSIQASRLARSHALGASTNAERDSQGGKLNNFPAILPILVGSSYGWGNDWRNGWGTSSDNSWDFDSDNDSNSFLNGGGFFGSGGGISSSGGFFGSGGDISSSGGSFGSDGGTSSSGGSF